MKIMTQPDRTIISTKHYEGIPNLPWIRTANIFNGICKKCHEVCDVVRCYSNYDGQYVTKCLNCLNRAFEGGFLRPEETGELKTLGENENFPREWKSLKWPFYCTTCKAKIKFFGKSKPDDFGEIIFEGNCEKCGLEYSGIRQELWNQSNAQRLIDSGKF